MPIPNAPLETTIPVGYTPHNELHIDVNEAVNYIAESAAAGLFLASPSGGAGVKDFRAITAADITAALASPPAIGGTTPAAGSFTAIVGATLALTNAAVSSMVQVTYTGASGSGGGAVFDIGQNDGAALASGDRLGIFSFRGTFDGSGTMYSASRINVFATEAWASGARGSDMRFEVTAIGSSTRTVVMTIISSQVGIAQDLKLTAAGKGIYVAEGSNATMGTATLVAGTVTVNTTKVTANSRIFLTINAPGGTVGDIHVSARVNGTSFTILSSSALDTSSVAWLILEPA